MRNRRPPLVVPSKYYPSIGHLADLGIPCVEKLATLADSEPITLDLDKVASRISLSIGTSIEISYSIISLLISLNDLRWERGQDPESLVGELEAAISAQAKDDWKQNHLDAWTRIAPKLTSLLAKDGFFSLLRKAFDLSLNRGAVVASLQILSDARPLYDENADTIKALVLSHTLVFRLQEGPDSRLLQVTLDAGDVRKLQEELARAEKKEATLGRCTSEWGIPLIQLDSGT